MSPCLITGSFSFFTSHVNINFADILFCIVVVVGPTLTADMSILKISLN